MQAQASVLTEHHQLMLMKYDADPSSSTTASSDSTHKPWDLCELEQSAENRFAEHDGKHKLLRMVVADCDMCSDLLDILSSIAHHLAKGDWGSVCSPYEDQTLSSNAHAYYGSTRGFDTRSPRNCMTPHISSQGLLCINSACTASMHGPRLTSRVHV